MKTSTFLLIIAIYGFITGGMMLFNATGSLQDYGVPQVDKYHEILFQYLGISNLGMALIVFLCRNSNNANEICKILIGYGVIAIGGVLLGSYKVIFMGLPANTFYYIDICMRLLEGFACLFFAVKVSKKR